MTDEFQHQFLGLVTRKLPNGAPNPAYDDVEVNGTPDGRVQQREAFIRARLRGRRRDDAPGPGALDDRDLTTFVSSDHGFAPQFAAIDASKVLVDLGLLSTAADLQLPPGDGRDDRQGQGLLGRRHRADLPQSRGRDPAGGRRSSRSRRPTRRATVAAIKAAFLALEDPNDWTGDGDPEGWEVIDRAYTKAEARYIPNGAGQHGRHGAPDPHRRPRRLLRAAVPVRRGDARDADRPLGVLRPARLRARRAGPRQRT